MDFIFRLAEEFLKKHKRLNRYRRVFAVIAAVVVFATTYELILPAITMDKRRAADTPGVEVGVAADSFEEEAAENESGESVEEENAGEESEETPEAESADPADTDADSGNGSDGSGNAADTDAASGHSTAGNAGTDLETSEGHSEEAGQEDGASDDANVKAEAADHADTAGTGSSDQTDASADKNGQTTETTDNGSTSEAADPADAAATTDPSLIAPGEPIVTYPATLVFEGKDYTITATFDETAGLPADVRLDAVEILPDVIYKDENGNPLYSTYEEYYEKAVKAVEKEKKLEEQGQTVTTARFFDITFLDNAGLPVEPKAPVSIAVKYKDALSAVDTADTMAVHFDVDEKKTTVEEPAVKVTDVIDTKTDVKKEEIQEISFDAEKFSVYGVLGTETITTNYITAEGDTYIITVSYNKEADIPEGATLDVKEITNSGKSYTDYVKRAAEALVKGEELPFVNAASLFDISIMADGKKVEPKAPVEVKIEYTKAENLNETSEVGAVHFKESTFKTEAEVMDINVQGEDGKVDGVTFTTESFSIYAVIIIDKEAGTFVVEDENYKVTIAYTKEANIPIGTEMTVRQIEYGSDEYLDLWHQTVEKLNEDVKEFNELEEDPRVGLTDATFFDISLNFGGKEIEPIVPVQVRIDYKSGILLPDEEKAGVIHFGKDKTEIINKVITEGEGAADTFIYNQSSFSPIGTYSTGEYINPDISLLSFPVALNAVRATSDGEVGVMAASKVLDPNDDGTYTLKLKVTGQTRSGTSSSVTKSNVVIVVDVSGSMGESAGRSLYTQSAEIAYKNSATTNTTANRSYGTSTSYYNGTGYYASRVYPTYDGTTYRWATYNSGSWSNYTGSVYISGSRLDVTKVALYELVDALLANNKNETITDSEGNVITLADTIEITLIQFANQNKYYNNQTYNDTRTLISNATTAGSPSQGNSLKGRISALTESGATNWEAALMQALIEANKYKNASTTQHAGTEADPITVMPNETTSVIFMTDGMPTFYGNDKGTGQEGKDNVHSSWNGAYDDAKALVTNGFTVYNIFAYGANSTGFYNDPGTTNSNLTPSDYLKSLTNYEYGVTNSFQANAQYRNNATTTYTSNYFFDASDTTKLQQAFEKIINSISNLVAFGGVDVHDGVSFGATNSTVLLNDGSIDPESFTYTVSTGTTVDYTVRVNSNGQPVFTFGAGENAHSYTGTATTVQVPDPTDPNNKTVTRQVYSVTVGEGDEAQTYVMPPAALYNKTEDGVTRQGIEWDLTGIGTLNGGQSYELSFIVWPNQDAYDLIAELNNGHTTLEQAAAKEEYADIVPYIHGSKETGYTLSTNWEQYVDYYRVEAETDENNNTTYNYIVQDPVRLNPGTATLATTKMFMNKVWNDSLDPTQIEKILAANPKYQIYLRIWKADTEETLESKIAANGDDYDQRVVLGWQEGTAEGTFLWTKDYTVAPGVMVKDGDTTAVNMGLTKENHEGYRIAKYRGDYYFLLEEGHYYKVSEENIDDHFILEEHVYHPMVVNGVVSDVSFNGVLADDPYGAIDVQSVIPMDSVNATNTLRGGINIKKVVQDTTGNTLSYDGTFKMNVTMNVPKDKKGNLDFSNVENYTDTDEEGNTIIVKESVAWYRYYDKDGNVVGATTWEGDVPTDHTEDLAFAGETNHAYGTWFYLDFNDTTGKAEGTIIVHPDYTVRFTNMATGTTYDLVETQTNGMTPTYSFTHVDAEGTVSTDGGSHTVEGNQENNILVTNTTPITTIELTKIGDWVTSNPLGGVQFKLYSDAEGTKQIKTDNTGTAIGADGVITTDAQGKALIGSLVTGTYYLIEVQTVDGYNLLASPVEFTIKADGTVEYSTGNQNFDATPGATYTTDDGYGIYINNPSGLELPKTGGLGTILYTLGGSVLMLGAALMYGFRMRRRERRLK